MVHDGDDALGLNIIMLVTHSLCGKNTTVANDKGCAIGCADLVSHLVSSDGVSGEKDHRWLETVNGVRVGLSDCAGPVVKP